MTPETPRERRSARRHDAGEGGYVLLALLLMMSLLVIATAAAVPKIAQQLRRDREEELIHRAMQYRRAIRTFAKRTGRFPLRIEELEGTDGTRYLRKRYKDPITGGDFRLLHPEDVQASGARLASDSTDQNANGASDQSAMNQAASQAVLNGDAAAGPSEAVGENSQTATLSGVSAAQAGAAQNSGSAAVASGLVSNASSNASSNAPSADNSQPHGTLILGVASSSNKKTIREFEHKSRYNQWLFFYSAIYDGSFEVKGPTPTNPIFPANKNSPGPPQSAAQAGQPSP
jgi:type II secretory pathway pseudopilin PulG